MYILLNYSIQDLIKTIEFVIFLLGFTIFCSICGGGEFRDVYIFTVFPNWVGKPISMPRELWILGKSVQLIQCILVFCRIYHAARYGYI